MWIFGLLAVTNSWSFRQYYKCISPSVNSELFNKGVPKKLQLLVEKQAILHWNCQRSLIRQCRYAAWSNPLKFLHALMCIFSLKDNQHIISYLGLFESFEIIFLTKPFVLSLSSLSMHKDLITTHVSKLRRQSILYNRLNNSIYHTRLKIDW